MRCWGCILLSVALLVACKQEKAVCYAYRHTPVEGWEQHNVQSFRIDSIRESGIYGLRICLRHTGAYPFQSLWLLVKQRYQHPDTLLQDTGGCLLTDKQGNHRGNGISIYQSEYPFRKIYLEKGSEGTVTVSHIMRRTILPGISDVGLLVKKED